MLRPIAKMLLPFLLVVFYGAYTFAEKSQPLTQIEVDYAKGELAYAQKDFGAAEKHFRTLIGRYPDASRAHYFLALSYLGQNKLAQAQEHFKVVSDIGQPADLAQAAQAYLADLQSGKSSAQGSDSAEKQKFYALNVSLGYRYDSNLLLNPDALTLVSQQNDHAWDAYVRAAIFPVQQQHWLLGFDYSFYNSHYFDHRGFSFNQHRVSAISARKYGILSTVFNPSFSALFMDGGRDRYEFLVQLPGTIRLDYAERWASEFYYRFEIRDFSNVVSQDLNITNAFLRNGVAHYPGFAQSLYFMERKGVAKIGIEFPVENASNPFDAAGPKGYGSLVVPLPYESQVEIFGSYMKKFYFHDYLADVGFTPNGINRRDDVIEAGATLKKNIWQALWIQGGYTFLNNNSNEFVFDTKNHMAMCFVGFDL